MSYVTHTRFDDFPVIERRSKFRMGDKVRNTKTGHRLSGRIIGIVTSEVYAKNIAYRVTWDDIFPGWRENHVVYYVDVGQPVIAITYKEFCEAQEQTGDYNGRYEESERSRFIAYVEDELELDEN